MQRITADTHGRTDGDMLQTTSRPGFSVAVTGFSVSQPVFLASESGLAARFRKIPYIIKCTFYHPDCRARRPTGESVIIPSQL